MKEIHLTLDENDNPVFLDPDWVAMSNYVNELQRRLDLDEVARLIVEPVVMAHTATQAKPKPATQMAAIAEREPSVSSEAHLSKSERFSFVADSRIGNILERDYKELQSLDPDTATKSMLVLSGGIIEGLLFDALVANGTYTFEQACNEQLKNMIYPALKEKIIKQDKLTDVLRSYRNLIHPAREVKDSLSFTASDANLAIHAVDIIIREVSEWHSNRNQPAVRPAAAEGSS